MLLEFAASLLPMTAALATPKQESSVILVTPPYNRMTNKELDERAERKRRWFAENPGEFKVQKNAYSMHATTEQPQTPSPWRVLASPWARDLTVSTIIKWISSLLAVDPIFCPMKSERLMTALAREKRVRPPAERWIWRQRISSSCCANTPTHVAKQAKVCGREQEPGGPILFDHCQETRD